MKPFTALSQPLRGLMAITALIALSACSTLTPPKQTPAKLLEQSRSSIVTTSAVSAATRSILVSSGHTQESCMADFEDCIQAIDATFLVETPSRLKLAVLSELYYTRAQTLIAQDACRLELDRPPIDPYYANAPLSDEAMRAQSEAKQMCAAQYREALYQTIKLSYAYLFYHGLGGAEAPSPIAQDADVRTLDLYHLAINDLVTQIYRADRGIFADAKIDDVPNSKTTTNHNQLPISTIYSQDQNQKHTIHLSVAADDYLQKILADSDDHRALFSDLISAYDSRLVNLDVNARRSGLGVSFIGAIHDRHTVSARKMNIEPNKPLDDRIHPAGHVQLTAMVQPRGDDLKQVLAADEFDAYFFNPSKQASITMYGTDHPLTANFSAGYALWLSENQLQQISLMNMISRQDAMALPELFMLKPYQPDQQVIIMLHGLASSPATWVNLTNTLLSDPKLNDNYQVWQIAYSTNLPILENRYQIHQLIRQAFQAVDPTGKDRASRNAVIIGHSMGGVISRMLVSDTDLTAALARLDDKKQYQLINRLPSDQRQAINDRLMLSALPQVDEAVFISAPHRGTDYADRWFTRAARRVIRLPVELTKSITGALSGEGSAQSFLGSLYLQNGASQLSDRSSFVALTEDVQISPSVRYHTIVGNHRGDQDSVDTVGAAISDGVVPYDSSHLEGAASETIITGRHNIHENPKTIVQLRKILHQHLLH
ncbi:alpha/beta hydrolase [Moraxella porci DSM 25326]|uniref:Alpha/beta hydrolase n=1 Tax=Moraxella porci DSM 25326 TaxID=573983 RepID=A0A1T0CSH2_9GAMM|nr:alpha/beta hydrolase [Moraxella porci]OOS25303.1 alpha/beta hydrolase [Moraxella porci DSM 25326]